MNKHLKKALLYSLLAFLISWLLAGIFYLSGGRMNTTAGAIMAVFYMFGPLASALIVQKMIYKQDVVQPLGIVFKLNPWLLAAWLVPLLLAFATMGVSLLFPGVSYSPEMNGMFERFANILTPEQVQEMKASITTMPVHPLWLIVIQGLIAGSTINAVAAFGEELGWRGLLQKELSYLGFWQSSLFVGFVWGLWHAPIIIQGHNYPQHPELGVLFMIIWCMLSSPLFSFVRIKTASVVGASVFHGSVNAVAGIAIIMITGGNDLLVGLTGAAGFLVLIIANILLLIYFKHDPLEKVPHPIHINA